MSETGASSGAGGPWESVHVCPNCGYVINLADIDLRAITTGIVSCPRCDWAGKIEIQIVGTGGSALKREEKR